MLRNASCLIVTLMLAAASATTAQASWIDAEKLTGQGNLSLHDSLAVYDPQHQQTHFAPQSLGTGSVSLGSENAEVYLDYDFFDASMYEDGHVELSISASGGGGDFTSAGASLTVNFTTTETLSYAFSPWSAAFPESGFSASLNDTTVQGHHDPLAIDLVDGNYFTDDWPASGVLAPGDHTFSFTYNGSGYRGYPWSYDAGVDLTLTAPPTTTVPEPTSAALLTLGALAALRRRRNRTTISGRSTYAVAF
ncbi:MAG: PEP-CTERM sorting domain-containing protein [Phycisphaeraceae bacterium]